MGETASDWTNKLFLLRHLFAALYLGKKTRIQFLNEKSFKHLENSQPTEVLPSLTFVLSKVLKRCTTQSYVAVMMASKVRGSGKNRN